VKYWLTEAGARGERVHDDTVVVHRLFDDARGCEKFAQRVLRFEPGDSRERLELRSDEVLYLLAGEGAAVIGGAAVPVRRGDGVYVSAGTSWSIRTEAGLDALSVLVRDPEPVPAGTHAVVDLTAGEKGHATASRQFALGVTPAAGCPSVTQFLGFIPPGRAPDHFHRYDEVIYILEGEGVLHLEEGEAPLEPGACVHLPAGLVHSLENSGTVELRLLGVFRPAGSPAEAYYPDGRPAVYQEGER
jgi:mannose-6-phosphate isomerase-like protein (cupin superfamily)